MIFESAVARTLVRMHFAETSTLTAHSGRDFTPESITVQWVWTAATGWTHIDTELFGPIVAGQQTPAGQFAQPDYGFYRAIPGRQPGDPHELPAEYAQYVEASRPTWTPKLGGCAECGISEDLTEQHNQVTGRTEPLCGTCHHEAVSGT